MTIVFFTSLWIVIYTYLGYGVIVWIWLKLRNAVGSSRPERPEVKDWPRVTLLIAAYNEVDILAEKLANCFDLDYPKDRLKFLFVSDGSSDGTPALLDEAEGIQHLHISARNGKIAAVKRAIPYVDTPFIVFTDANTFLNRESIKRLIRHFEDETVGAVAGEKRVRAKKGDQASAAGEGLYWKYESLLKKQDAELYSVVGAAGELYAIRTPLFQAIPGDAILDDFEQTLQIAAAGYRVTYDPDAYAEEEASANLAEELKRKIRICAGGFQAMSRLLPLLNPFKYGILSFQYISHRVLRWTLAPLSIPLLFLANLYLLMQENSFFYLLFFLLQIGFYVQAGVAYLLRNRKVNIKGFFVPLYFCIMNYAVFAGFSRFIRKTQSVNWEKAKRASQV